jgi:hypothetical protein
LYHLEWLTGLPTVKKPDSTRESVVLPAAIDTGETMFGDSYAKEHQTNPLADNTVVEMSDISEDVSEKLIGRLKT